MKRCRNKTKDREHRGKPWTCLVAPAFGLIGLGSACSPSAPSQSEAREAFVERRARVEAFEASLFGLLGRSSSALTTADLEPWVDAAGALGFDGAHLLPSVHPCIGGTGHGTVDPKDGLSEDHYLVGYGIYQTAWEGEGRKHGDGDFHQGIAVRWRLGGEEGLIKDPVTLCMLVDGTSRPK